MEEILTEEIIQDSNYELMLSIQELIEEIRLDRELSLLEVEPVAEVLVSDSDTLLSIDSKLSSVNIFGNVIVWLVFVFIAYFVTKFIYSNIILRIFKSFTNVRI